MNEATATCAFNALYTGDGYVWDCRVLFRDGYFKANAIQLVQLPKVKASLKLIKRRRKSHDQHGYDLDLAKYMKEAVLEFMRFVYLSETANLTTQSEQGYLAEQVWGLAVEFEIAELQEQCLTALRSDSITVDEGNFLRLAQIGAEMNSKPLVKTCLTTFQQKFAINAEDAIKEVREAAPMFLNAVIAEARYYRPPVSIAPASPQTTGDGFAIDPHDWDDEVFDEVLSSDHFDETKRHLSDFEIHCSDVPDRPIRCHRNILARVPHFRQMILYDCEESRKKFVLVKQEREVMIETLRYVYTGKNTDLPHRVKDQDALLAESVIDLAQQYGLYVLKHRCHQAMLECDISHSNVLRLFGVAVLYELKELKSKCLCYFFDNRKVLLTTNQWQNADVAIVRAIVEYVLVLSTYERLRFCVYVRRDLWTWTRLVQLDYRTVMLFTTDRQARLFDVIDHSVTDCPPLLFEHYSGSACLFNGDVYVTGGSNGDADEDNDDDLCKCERYNRATNTWEPVADMNRGRSSHGLVVWEGNLHVIGGCAGCSIERYDAVSDRWEVIRESVGTDDHFVHAAVINSDLWVCLCVSDEDSEDGEWLWKAWKVDLNADEWIEIPAPDTNHGEGMYIFEHNCRAHLLGWKSGSTYLFAFDEDAGGWKDVFEIDNSRVDVIPIVSGEI